MYDWQVSQHRQDVQARQELQIAEFHSNLKSFEQEKSIFQLIQDDPEYQTTYKQICSLLQNKTYTIAVIGKFQTGKSTFLNALLRAPDLLKVGAGMPTTSAATYIKYGKISDLQISFKDGETLSFRQDQESLFQKITSFFRFWESKEEQTERQMSEFIHKITTQKYDENAREDTIERITITYPSNFLKDGLILIDTPGTDIEKSDHSKVTEEIVKKVDACVLLFSADQNIPKDYFEFLEKHNIRNLSKLFFVVTKADKAMEANEIDDDIGNSQLSDVIRGVRKTIAARLKLSKPKVYSLACEKILEDIVGKRLANIEIYREQQKSFEEDLVQFIELERKSLVLSKISKMILSMCQKLQEKIQARTTNSQEKLKELQSKRILDLSSFIQQHRWNLENLGSKKIEHFQKETSKNCELFRSNVMYDLQNTIYSANNNDELKQSVERIKGYCSYQVSQNLQKLCEIHNHLLTSIFRDISETLHQRFVTLYRQLPQDQLELDYSLAQLAHYQDSYISNIDVQSIFQQVDNDIGDGIASGTIFGGALGIGLGLAIGGLLGVATGGLGLLLGGLLGGLFSEPSLDELKSKVWQKIQETVSPKLDTFFANYSNSLQNAQYRFQQFLENMVTKYSKEYRDRIEALIQKNLAEEAKIQKEIAGFQQQKSCLEDYQIIFTQLQESIQQDLDILQNKHQIEEKQRLQSTKFYEIA